MFTLRGKSVLLAGGAGFIGSHLAEEIARHQPGQLVIVDNLFLGKRSNLDDLQKSCSFVLETVDAGDREAMHRIVTENKVQVVFNLAAIPLPASLERPRFAIEQTIAPTTVLCELARQKQIESLVHFSSSEVYGTARYVPMDEQHPTCPQTPYAASKLATDWIVLSYRQTFGIDAVIVRPFNNFGPRQNGAAYAGLIPEVIRRARNGGRIEIHGDGEQTRDFMFVKDTARGAVAAYCQPESRGKVINLGSGKETSVNQMVRLLLGGLGAGGIEIQHVPPRPGDVRRHCAKVDLARELLGFQPAVTLQDGLNETIEWYTRTDGNGRMGEWESGRSA